MNELGPTKARDIEHNIRNRLVAIALCAENLRRDFSAFVSPDQERQFHIIQSSVLEIKAVLDQLASRFQSEISLLKNQLNGYQLVGAPARAMPLAPAIEETELTHS